VAIGAAVRIAASAWSCSGELNQADSTARRDDARVVETAAATVGV